MRLKILLCCLALLFPGAVHSTSWNLQLTNHDYWPLLFMAVDKSAQQAYLVQPATKTQATATLDPLICSTGKRDGDKEKEGDLKTPEGVYFIVEKISSGLDFTEYGNTAFPLNYPNPIDRLRGKTGYGIWIHGRGTPLTPKITRGCVSLLNADVDSLDQKVALQRTPIIIAQNLTWTDNATQPEFIADIAQGTWAWVNGWRQGQPSRDLYDAQLYARSSGQDLEQAWIQTQNQRQPYTWMDLRLKDLQIIEGPGYMVSAFTQYTLPHGDSGYRRLYWMQVENSWKIVGEEWVAQDWSFPHYVQVLNQEVQDFFNQAAQWWMDNQEYLLMDIYAPQSRRGSAQGRTAIVRAVRQDLSTTTVNPFQGQLSLAILAQGLEATLDTAQGPRKFLLHPGPSTTWQIIAEDWES